MNLYGLIGSRLPATRHSPFLIEADGTELSYAALDERTAALAGRLAGLGVAPGDRVAVQAEKSIAGLLLYLATLRAGAVHLPLNPTYTAAEVRYFLEDSEPALFVGDPARGGGARRAIALSELAEGALDSSAGFEDVDRAPEDLAAILYTSGTTGRSKGAMLTHANLASNAETLREAWRFTAADRLLHALPIFHTHGLFVATNVTLLAGGAMIFLPAFDLDEILRLLPDSTAMMGVPTFYTRLLSRPDFTRELTAHIRLFVSGSAPLSAETHRAFEARTGHAILERYGMTETNMNTSNPYEGPRVAGTVGPPLPGVEIRIADREGEALPRGEVGMIEIRGPNVCKGYWRMPDKTAEAFRPDGYFISGDMGLIDEAGYVRIVGRDKDLIITGGLNVYPAEVEAAIEAIDGVAECAVIGVPHPDFGEGVVAVVIPHSGQALAEHEMKEALKETLAAFKRPKRVVLVEALPRNAMGKVQKKVLRETYGSLLGGA